MKTQAAVILETGQDWTVREIDLAPPQAGEVLVEFTHAGLCFSDEHLRDGNLGALPAVGGHEGAGIVREVGPGVTGLEPGDHVAASFVPTCGQCDWCVTGRSNLCEQAANDPDSTDTSGHRFSIDGEPVPANCGLGTFARFSVVRANTVIKVSKDVPLAAVAVASCGVLTGFGAAVHAGKVTAGDVVLVLGAGGVGVNAVQGARIAGARDVVVVDSNPVKLETAREFGATSAFESMADAVAHVQRVHPVASGADVVIVATGNTTEGVVTAAYSALGKGGTLVLAGMSQDVMEKNIHLAGTQLIFKEQTIRGTIFGSSNPRHDIPMILDLYARGVLKLDELVSRQYSLDEINRGFEDLRTGKNLRGVLAHAGSEA
ncbi:zinc-binding dehydrogenase [Agrococcus sp. HG114]|uniref:zinc-binding dehydrogenase n=1 Tax=Agrococcus sp. HG114 TaxID=2969757 RepID=UPI00215A2DC5|nr:zinc-binding dehydrogenase [Agrococcus sp. HG114]MCR8669790.1 zinc-binding dehydrogenase [Agrococcus sp. HG114]